MTLQLFSSLLFLAAVALPACCDSSAPRSAEENRTLQWGHNRFSLKPRLLVLTDVESPDNEPDDLQSLIHLAASADMVEIEGLIATTGWNFDYPDPLQPGFIYDVISRYKSDLPNLMKRSNQVGFRKDETRQMVGYWPSPELLFSRVYSGLPGRGMIWVGDKNATNGSNWIIDVVDRDDERPVYVTIWGGGNTLAQAIWDVRRTRSSHELQRFLSKIRVYAITDQDKQRREDPTVSSHLWMRENFPELTFIYGASAWTYFASVNRDEYWNSTYKTEIQGKGALGALYPVWRYGVEGDTPSWQWIWPGLNDPEDPTQSSFGGRFLHTLSPDNRTISWNDGVHADPSGSREAVRFTVKDQLNNFIARMDWVAQGSGNRNPKVVLNGDSSYAPVKITAKPRAVAKLSTQGSTDPEGDSISYQWYIDKASTYVGSVSLTGNGTNTAELLIPPDASAKTIHVIVRASDDGAPSLASYRRAIIYVSDSA